jgi:hypothetical protein
MASAVSSERIVYASLKTGLKVFGANLNKLKISSKRNGTLPSSRFYLAIVLKLRSISFYFLVAFTAIFLANIVDWPILL